MHVATKVNLPILTSYFIFPNKKGLKILQKFVPKIKSMSDQVFNFQDIQEKDVQVMLPFEPKKNQPWRRVEFKRKW
jgi:hypothetical protein